MFNKTCIGLTAVVWWWLAATIVSAESFDETVNAINLVNKKLADCTNKAMLKCCRFTRRPQYILGQI